jgi:hypothetical protein
MNTRQNNALTALGIILSYVGLFLPWGTYPSGIFGYFGTLFGYELLLGSFAFVGCIITTISWIMNMRKPKRWSLGLMLLGGLIVIFASSIWILDTRFYPWFWDMTGNHITLHAFIPSLQILSYGAFISLFGSIITSIISIFNLYQQRRG